MTDSANVWAPRDSVTEVNNFSSVVRQTFTATAGQQIFNLSAFAYVAGTNSLLVYKNGLLLVNGVDYNDTGSTKFTLVTGATAGDTVMAVGFIGYINALVDPYYLGPKATAPTVDNQGITLAAMQEGYHYWNTVTKDSWTWTGVIWQLTTSSVATSANLVSVADAGGYFLATDVESVLQEVGSRLITVAPETTTIVGVANTTIELTGLVLPDDKDIQFELSTVSAGIVTTALRLVLNGDAVATNYNTAYTINGAAVVQANSNKIGVLHIGNGANVALSGTISPNTVNGETLVTIHQSYWNGSINVASSSTIYTIAGIITSIGFVEDTGVIAAIGIGSRLTIH